MKIPKLSIATLVTLILYSSNINAQFTEKDIINEFFRIYPSEPLKAFDYAFFTNPWLAKNFEGTENLKFQFKELLPLLGNYVGYDLLITKQINDRFKLYSFMIRYERQPLRFTFIFYKSNA